VTEDSGARGAAVHVIDETAAGQRIDNWLLSRLKGWPRSHVYRLLRSGQVRVNSGRRPADYRLVAGDRVRLPPQARPARDDGRAGVPPALRQRLATCIIAEDEHFLVLDKPAGLAVHGGSGISFGVIEILRALRPEAAFLELVHRLDRETSGCLLVAKRRPALRALHEQFRENQVEKRYLALVRGRWQRGRDTVDLALEVEHRAAGERHVVVGAAGKPATTSFRLVEDFGAASLLEVMPHSGRTHQIRVHARAVSHPLAGDERYGDPDFNTDMAGLGLRRLFLHAHLLGFRHPQSGEPRSISAPLPVELASVLERLGAPRRGPGRRRG
jgi:23S rRNA pseudouridine955/2504/2580 synthase